MRHLHRSATGLWDFPNVVHRLERFRRSRFRAHVAIGDEEDLAVAIHRPQGIRLHVVGELGVQEFLERLRLEIGDPEISRITAAIMLPPPNRWMAVERQVVAGGRITSPGAPIGGERLLETTLQGDLVEVRDAGVKMPSRRGEDDSLAVARPSDDRVRRAVEGELLRLAAAGGHHIDIVVAGARGREGDPLAVGREARMRIVCRMHRETVRIAPVVFQHPQIAAVAEDNPSARAVGMPGDTNDSGGCRISNEKGNQAQASEGILPHRVPPEEKQEWWELRRVKTVARIVIGNPSLAAVPRYSDRGRISEIGPGGALVLARPDCEPPADRIDSAFESPRRRVQKTVALLPVSSSRRG